MKMWSDIGTSPKVWDLVHSTPASPGSAGREHFQVLLPTFPAATAHQTLVAKVLSALCVHRVRRTGWKSPFFPSFWVGFFSFCPLHVWFSCLRRRRKEELQPCPIACVNHSAHQNSSWVAPYPGDPAKHFALGSRIVPELWMLEKHSNNSDTDSCCYSNLKSCFFFLILFFCFHLIPHFRPWSWKRAAPPMCCAWLNTYS